MFNILQRSPYGQRSMKRILFSFYFLLLTFDFFGQTVTQKLQKAFTAFEKDSQLKHAISSLYVIDAATGQVVFNKNSQIGLAPASTQKIITSVTAFELLGKDYRYKTEVYKSEGWSYIVGYGDPTLGSWRYNKDADKVFFSRVVNALKNNPGIIATSDYYFEHLIPKGWIYEDIGNYYGADAKGINWRENQYDLILIPGEKEGDRTDIDTVFPGQFFPGTFKNHCLTGPKGSGDNAYIYFQPPYSDNIVKGTIPLGPKRFSISGADPHPAITLSSLLMKFCDSLGIKYSDESKGSLITDEKINATTGFGNPVYTHYSPPLDSIIYWFNKKSVNLYGEALMETFAYEKNGYGSTDSGIVIVKKFWKEKGMDENEINIVDGSGLSPLNRVTTHVQVEILKYAKSKNWFPYFFNSLPEYNGMKIKSGTIRGVKGFCGYHKARNGNEYIFSFLVNNYNGSASAVVNKMYKVLDILK